MKTEVQSCFSESREDENKRSRKQSLVDLFLKVGLVPAEKCGLWKGGEPVENAFHTVHPSEPGEDPEDAETCPAIWGQKAPSESGLQLQHRVTHWGTCVAGAETNRRGGGSGTTIENERVSLRLLDVHERSMWNSGEEGHPYLYHQVS